MADTLYCAEGEKNNAVVILLLSEVNKRHHRLNLIAK